jgi:hypothetical protein
MKDDELRQIVEDARDLCAGVSPMSRLDDLKTSGIRGMKLSQSLRCQKSTETQGSSWVNYNTLNLIV